MSKADAIQKAPTFEERMMNRIRDGIGDMMTDQELKKIVNRGVEEAFFGARTDVYKRPLDPLIYEIVRDQVKDQVSAQVKQWLKEHPDQVAEIVERVLGKSVEAMLRNAVEYLVGEAFRQFEGNLLNRLQGGY